MRRDVSSLTSRNTRLALAAACLLIAAGLAIGARPFFAHAAKKAIAATAPEGPAQAAAQTGNRVRSTLEAELITIHPHGFEPHEIRPAHGHFILEVDDQAWRGAVLRLERESGERLLETEVVRGRSNWVEELDLAPGRYVLSEAGHPNWTCAITVTTP
jgi:hypothetical protein